MSVFAPRRPDRCSRKNLKEKLGVLHYKIGRYGHISQNIFYALFYYHSLSVLISCRMYVAMAARQKTVFPHPVGIVLAGNTRLGRDCTIYQNVTIGGKDNQYPVLGDRCIIYPNSCIIGHVTIGENAVIGAGSVVLEDVPANSIVAGNPARILQKKS